MSGPTKLKFHCNVCACELVDSEAIFTSCGHFFCSRCTKIQPGRGGVCEVCSSEADSGSLAGRGLSYNEHVKLFVFGDPSDEIKKLAEMVKVTSTCNLTTMTRCVSSMPKKKEP
mmetsp:Transcript_12576/g.38448  ORF Transcript_12576/g.38448 Transcript_12576/m.38448 type:complete len:114 (-) Transcript_12576:2666-3007(-)